jgi:FtsZ-interacting cell division protein ZipA
MSRLQLGLIVAGVLLVVAVLIYNAWQERRMRRRMVGAMRAEAPAATNTQQRIEPTLGGLDPSSATTSASPSAPPADARAAVRVPTELPASPFAVPMDDVVVMRSEAGDGDVGYDEARGSDDDPARGYVDDDQGRGTDSDARSAAAFAGTPQAHAEPEAAPPFRSTGPQPDPDIECIIGLTPAQPVTVADLAGGLHARLGKPLRWFGRAHGVGAWQLVTDDATDRFDELVACLLLADRNGALSEAQLNAFLRVAGELGTAINAKVSVPSMADEVQRAEALDRLCAELDVQIGLTLLKGEQGAVAGTRLRGVAEAAGFHLAPGGRFEHLQEDTGTVLYTLQNVRSEPFTAESLRVTATNGVVFVLDVPRVADPARAFDQMKLAARRMAHTLGAALVDDNRRPLDVAALD